LDALDIADPIESQYKADVERARMESRDEEMRADVVGLRDELKAVRAERNEVERSKGSDVAELERMDGEMAAFADRVRHAGVYFKVTIAYLCVQRTGRE
jgi:predicted aminopeptidase